VVLGEEIRRRRAERNLTLGALSRLSGVSKGYLHGLENAAEGTSRPSAEVLDRIAFALDTTVGALLGKRVPRLPDESVEIPDSLRQFALRDDLPEEDVRMLACIEYRGDQPDTVDDWRFLYLSIKQAVRKQPP
jgi:transcriptional regulator with XRE-family HTH domain